ncbi:unnamed protein product [Didymodactylos carnosus]|uniref:Uncharacterized protein n=2 Tax=Didymodactylos carnosus TaxID=1234261 RepID=A0A816C6H0_9BILA|nr:unnamed protein product [Didymodactylos carnosus]CAF4506549.1 unnamed protein product [Didymodactylos carnosus]
MWDPAQDPGWEIAGSRREISGMKDMGKHQSRRCRSENRLPKNLLVKTKRSRSVDGSLFPKLKIIYCSKLTYKIDTDRRHHIRYSTSGKLHICRHSDTYYKSSSQMHINHLENILEQNRLSGKSVYILTSDNGPDWPHKCGGNIFNFDTLREELNLGVLIVNSYAANDSKYNPVERTLSYLSKQLTSVVLNRKISNKTSEQNNLDNAVTVLCSYWDKKFYDSYQIPSIPVISHSILLYDGHSDRINLLRASPPQKW